MLRPPVRTVATTIAAGVALSAMTLLVASPAGAHTDNIYTYLHQNVTDPSFSTIDRTNGVVAALPTPSGLDQEMMGIKVTNEVGTAIARIDNSGNDDYYVLNWDHTTGAPTTPIDAFITAADESEGIFASGLDELADGTLLTYVEYTTSTNVEVPTFTDHAAIASVNTTTGELTPIVDLDSLLDLQYSGIELATDPISGDTYLFLSSSVGDASYFAKVDVAGNSLGTVTQFAGAGFESGFFQGADFDNLGTLYFIYGNNNREIYELSSLGSPATWTTASRTYLADAASNYSGYPLDTLALTVEHTDAPALAKTGAPEISPAWGAAAGVLVLGGVVLLAGAARRRKRA